MLLSCRQQNISTVLTAQIKKIRNAPELDYREASKLMKKIYCHTLISIFLCGVRIIVAITLFFDDL
jgi:hypothetical protein